MGCLSATITPIRDDSLLEYLYSSDDYALYSSDPYALATGHAGGGVDVGISVAEEVMSVSISLVCSVS